MYLTYGMYEYESFPVVLLKLNICITLSGSFKHAGETSISPLRAVVLLY